MKARENAQKWVSGVLAENSEQFWEDLRGVAGKFPDGDGILKESTRTDWTVADMSSKVADLLGTVLDWDEQHQHAAVPLPPSRQSRQGKVDARIGMDIRRKIVDMTSMRCTLTL